MHHSTAQHNTTSFFFRNFTIYRKNNIKIIQNFHRKLAPFSLNIQSNKTSQNRFSNHKTPFIFQKKIPSHDMTQFEHIPVLMVFFFHWTIPTSPDKDFWWNQNLSCSVDWGCRIHRLLLCRGVRPPNRVSWIWH